MTDMKCPFCQRELEQITTSNPLGLGRIEMAVCKKCMDKGVLHIMPIWDWQELIRTRKALEIAVDALREIDKTRSVANHKIGTQDKTLNSGIVFCWTTPDEIHNALEQITALEQKDK